MKKVRIEIIAEYENDVTNSELEEIKYIATTEWQDKRSLDLETNWSKSNTVIVTRMNGWN